MKMWQFFMLLAQVIITPHVSKAVAIPLAGFTILAGIIALIAESRK